ncbi:winged helix-turn-helix transcriptional regulator [Aeromicrobium sp.]|uniref:winged helix-turn-helix transcriptional regulator n=1 Tax=Aeromicrobium sp. TaxID=1871063 RepID=UPI002FC8A7FF
MEEGTSTSPGSCDVTGETDAFQWDTREDCEVRQILDRVADKWSLMVISLLGHRTLRFTELKREIDGVSQRMLTVTLRHLERDGLIQRTVHPVVPPRVDYELTDLGCGLIETIQSLVRWTESNQEAIIRARIAFDQRQAEAAASA